MASFVSFYNADVQHVLRSKKQLRAWLASVVKKEGFVLGELNIILCSDEYLYQMNLRFLKHKTYTDIITFDQSEEEGVISGELYISIDRVRDNSNSLNISTLNELHRVIVHGLLHLCGYGDKTPKAKAEMTLKENFYLAKRAF